jgi:Ca2+-binding EF-hand superfamily protein
VLSDFRRQKVASGFAQLDVNGDGQVESSDIDLLIRNHGEAYGFEPGSAEYEDLLSRTMAVWDQLKQFDTDGDGAVSLAEYVAGWDAFLEQRDVFMGSMDQLVESFFSMADRNRDGLISEEELVMHWRAWQHPEPKAREAFGKLDRQGKGGISKADWMLNLEEFYYSEDPEAPGTWLAPLAE